MIFKAGQFQFTFPAPTLVMGIVNVTPDSFSDGGQYLDVDRAVRHALELIRQGAIIIDIGGESTRPGAELVAEAEELSRVLPVIERLAGQTNTVISIDTRKVAVAEAALRVGASIVNDVGANREDPAMWRLVAQAHAGYVCLHMQGTPQTMQKDPSYKDVTIEVGEFFSERISRLNDCGVQRDQIMLDPGIGFGKTAQHNLQLLGALRSFARYERPLVLGVSRKSFIGKVTGVRPGAGLPGALACACLAIEAGVQVLRVHDVDETIQAVRMTEAILAQGRNL